MGAKAPPRGARATSQTQATQSGIWVTALYSGPHPHPSSSAPATTPAQLRFLLPQEAVQEGAGSSSGIVRQLCAVSGPAPAKPMTRVTATAIFPCFRLAPLHPAKQSSVTLASPWACSALPPPCFSASTLAAPMWFIPRWPWPRVSAPFCSLQPARRAEPGFALLSSLTDSG